MLLLFIHNRKEMFLLFSVYKTKNSTLLVLKNLKENSALVPLEYNGKYCSCSSSRIQKKIVHFCFLQNPKENNALLKRICGTWCSSRIQRKACSWSLQNLHKKPKVIQNKRKLVYFFNLYASVLSMTRYWLMMIYRWHLNDPEPIFFTNCCHK